MSSRVWFFRIEDILDALERIDQSIYKEPISISLNQTGVRLMQL